MIPILLDIRQGHDDITKSTQTLINLLALLQSLACGPRNSQPLTACQIHQIQLPHLDLLHFLVSALLFFPVAAHLLDYHLENSVRPRGHVVQLRFSSCSR